MFVLCSVLIYIGNGNVLTSLEGKLLKETKDTYTVDFTQGITSNKIPGPLARYYKHLEVKKEMCYKEGS